MYYLMWLDLDQKKTDEQKVKEATRRFEERFGYFPTEVLVKGGGIYWLGPIDT